MKMYEVGGCVRDEILGIRSKDIDFSVVLEQGSYADPYQWMVEELESEGFKIFRDKEGQPIGHEHFTARGRFPANHPTHIGAADFVLARREGSYADRRRPDWVQQGTLEDDLNRRDFTMNAIAKDGDGNLIDPHGGVLDIRRRLIRAVGDPLERLLEDPLRALRAIRFAVTKGFNIDPNLRHAMAEPLVVEGVAEHVSDERITEEFSKAFRADTVASLLILSDFPALMAAAFSGSVSLDATMKTKGRPSQKKPSDKPAYNCCQCLCHTEKGVMHMSACCRL